MSIDLSKLSPAPWHTDDLMQVYNHEYCVADCGYQDEADFIALARNAFDVMLRRGWGVERVWDNDLRVHRWYIVTDAPRALREGFADPFTALVEADRWYAENVEGSRGAAT